MRLYVPAFACLIALAPLVRAPARADEQVDAPAITESLLDQVIATQRQTFGQFSALFSYRVEETELWTPRPDNTALPVGAIVDGTIIHARAGSREFISARYELPPNYKYQAFQEVDEWHDRAADRSTTLLIPSRQLLRLPYSGATLSPSPGTFFLARLQDTIEERSARGAKFEAIDRNGVVGFRLSAPADGGSAVEGLVDPTLDFAITEWAEDGGFRAKIEWERTPQGIAPVKAVLATAAGDRRWTLETRSFHIGPPNPRQLEFRFEPRMLVTDHAELIDGKPQVYKIDESGRRVNVLIAVPPRPVSLGQRGGVAGVAALVVVGALALRFRR